MAPSPFWVPPPHVRPHELPHDERRRNAADLERTRTFTDGVKGVQEPPSRSRTSVPRSIPRNQGLVRIGPPPGPVATNSQSALPDTHMPSLPLNGDALLCFPNLVMRWTTVYANSVTRRERLQYIRRLADVEANTSPEDEDEFVRMLADQDSGEQNDAQVHGAGIQPIRQQKRKGKTSPLSSRRRSGPNGNEEDRERADGALITASSSLSSSLSRLITRTRFSESSRIHGIGLPAQSSQSTVILKRKDGKQLPPTPAELAAFQDHGGLPIEASAFRSHAPAGVEPPGSKSNTAVVLGEGKRTETPDLGWPPVDKLFADLPEPVTPVFQKEDLPSSVQTIWNRRKERRVLPHHPVEDLNQPWLSQGRQTEEPEEFVRKSPSVHSSASGSPPSDLLAESKLEDPKPGDSGIFLEDSFGPILAFLHHEWTTTRLLHRHLCSTLTASPPISAPNNTVAEAVLVRKQHEVHIGIMNECRHHIDDLKKWYRNTKKLMELTIEATQSAAVFRLGVEDGNAAEGIKETLRAERSDEGRNKDACGSGSKRMLKCNALNWRNPIRGMSVNDG